MTRGRVVSPNVVGWLLVLPAAVLLVTFTHFPTAATLYHSFFSTAKPSRPSVWVGLDNYRAMVEDPVFWQVLQNNLWFALGTIPASIALAILMAVWVNGKIAGRGFLRLSFFTPTVLPMIAVANIWLFFYTPGYGLLEQITGLFGLPSHNWLGSRSTALPCLIVVTVWKEADFFRRVTFPLLMPTTLFVLINAVINSFRLVDHIVVMTKGGPDNATALLLYYVYDVGFKFWDTGYAAALTMVLLALLAALAVGQFVFFERRIHYQ